MQVELAHNDRLGEHWVMTYPGLTAAVEAWRDALGGDHVWTGDAVVAYADNVTGWSREIPAVLRPSTSAEVVAVVETANRYRVPLYPFSGGKNWGLGSRLPVRTGSVLVDLARMNRIEHIDAEGLFAVVEPGVTQQQLYEALGDQGVDAMLNVTGSGRESSLIGNALERGIGYFSSRADELCGLEVVLGNGEILRTGFAHLPDCGTTYLYRHGVGPSLDGLFTQGNFGIVIRAGLHLMPKPEVCSAMICRLRGDNSLGPFVDVCRHLYRSGLITSVLHLGNQHRTEAALTPLILSALRKEKGMDEEGIPQEIDSFLESEGYTGWTAICGLHGTKAAVCTARREIRRAVKTTARVMFLDDAKLNRLTRLANIFRCHPVMRRKSIVMPAIRDAHGLSQGIPTSEPIKSLYSAVGEPSPQVADPNPDQSFCGVRYFLPLIPLSGEAACEAEDLVKSVFRGGGFVPYITFNILDHRTLEAVISISFRRGDPTESDRANEVIDTLREEFKKRGWYPYRVGVEEMDSVVDPSSPRWKTVYSLKSVLDPNDIIAPGRYNL